MKPLLALPEAVCKQLLRVETKLGRTLTRSRAEKLVAAWSHLHQEPTALVSRKTCSMTFPCRGPVARVHGAPRLLPAPSRADMAPCRTSTVRPECRSPTLSVLALAWLISPASAPVPVFRNPPTHRQYSGGI